MSESSNETAEPKAVSFDEVFAREKEIIRARRHPAESGPGPTRLAGLAFSGGGIRSAVFNLGFIQGLANKNALHVFDYLSTVSGGGYIGGWLSALLYRKSTKIPAGEEQIREVQETYLQTHPKDAPPPGESAPPPVRKTDFPRVESSPIRFVRRYSNYLTPRLGLSGDTLALISLMMRNVTVMQLLLLSLLVAVFAGLTTLVLAWDGLGNSVAHRALLGMLSLGTIWLALSGALRLQERENTSANQEEHRPPTVCTDPKIFVQRENLPNPGEKAVATVASQKQGIITVLILALLSGLLAAIFFGKFAPTGWKTLVAPLVVALVYALIWIAQSPPKKKKAWLGVLGGAVVLGAAAALAQGHPGTPFHLAFAPLAAMLAYGLTLTVHLALSGNAISDDDEGDVIDEQVREWWARLGGMGMFAGVAWMGAFLFLFFAPPLLQYGWNQAIHWLVAGGGLWATLTWVGAKAAQSRDTGAGSNKLSLEILAKIGPWVFLTGLLGAVAWVYAVSLVGADFHGTSLGDMSAAYQKKLTGQEPYWPVLVFSISGILFWILVRQVDLNVFSAHSFYTNRLARTFMGATQEVRDPNPYTGFDPGDDLALAKLAGQRPIPIVNATLNLTGGEDLAWQTRRGACFTFTPCHSGYAARASTGKALGGFQPTSQYAGGLSLATVVATSGAAASPNMGFHTSTSVAALMTAFNLRLARWCPNPEKDQWQRRSPKNAAAPLFAELFGNANGKNTWVNLSDGGHFENLAIYELIRRRAALILVTDVAADPDYRYDDLAMAVRKIWVDFGVRVEIDEADLDAIRPRADKESCKGKPCFSETHWAFGRICYPDAEPGYLVYVKSSLTADAPIDIRQYYDAHPTFPHETTADQWFDEDQFEAYRHLGQIVAEKLIDGRSLKINGNQSASKTIDSLYAVARSYFQQKPCPDA